MRIASAIFAFIAFCLTASASLSAANHRPIVEARLAEAGAAPIQLTLTTASADGTEVLLTLAPASAKALGSLTAAHLGSRLAIVIDGVVRATPTIKAAIDGGKVSITLHSADEAAALARALMTR
jgi:preprotein translocase subunit SecD